MVQSLQLSARLTQSLVLAPQLQQSLALLQAPTLELKALVEQELQQNPVLEEVSSPEPELGDRLAADEEETDASAEHAEPSAESTGDTTLLNDTALLRNGESNDTPADDFQAEFDRLVQLGPRRIKVAVTYAVYPPKALVEILEATAPRQFASA